MTTLVSQNYHQPQLRYLRGQLHRTGRVAVLSFAAGLATATVCLLATFAVVGYAQAHDEGRRAPVLGKTACVQMSPRGHAIPYSETDYRAAQKPRLVFTGDGGAGAERRREKLRRRDLDMKNHIR